MLAKLSVNCGPNKTCLRAEGGSQAPVQPRAKGPVWEPSALSAKEHKDPKSAHINPPHPTARTLATQKTGLPRAIKWGASGFIKMEMRLGGFKGMGPAWSHWKATHISQYLGARGGSRSPGFRNHTAGARKGTISQEYSSNLISYPQTYTNHQKLFPQRTAFIRLCLITVPSVKTGNLMSTVNFYTQNTGFL